MIARLRHLPNAKTTLFPLVALCTLVAIQVMPNSAQAQLVSTDLNGRSAAARARVTLTLTWSQPVRLALTTHGRDVHIRTGTALDHSGFTALARRLQPWLASVQLGYDSAVLRLRAGVSATHRLGPTSLALSLTRPNVAPKRRRFDPGAARRRLALLKASLLWSTGDAWAASQLLQKMRAKHPDDTDLLTAQAVVETRLGRWRRASQALHTARTKQGVTSRGSLPVQGSVEAPSAEIATRSDRQSDGQERLGLDVGGHGFIAPGLRLQGRYTFAQLPEQRAHRGKLGLRRDLLSGSFLSVNATAATNQQRQFGAAGTFSLWDRTGETTIEANWNEASWALPALVAVQARRSALGLRRTVRSIPTLGRPIAGDVSLSVSAHLERWQSAEDGAAPGENGPTGRRAEEVTDIFANATIRYVSWRSQPRIWANYSILHLQRLGETSIIPENFGPDLLSPLLAQSHIHSLNAGVRVQVWRWLELTGHGGYGLRIGGADAVQFGAGLSWTPPSGIRVNVSFDRGFQGSTYGVSTTQLIAQAAVVF